MSLFLALKAAERRAPSTLAGYKRSLEMFLADTPNLPDDVAELGPRHAIAWTATLIAPEKKLKPGAVNAYQRPVWVWFRWLNKSGMCPYDIPRMVSRVPVRAPNRRTAPEEAKNKLVECALARAEHRYRNAAIIQMLWATGIRRDELAHVRFENVDTEAGTVHLEKTKSGKPRTIALSAECRLALEQYFVHERGRKPGPLFRSRLMQPMSNNAIKCVLRSLAESAGVTVTSHDFRRAAASRMRKGGMDLGHVMRQLGHQSPAMTLIYSEEGETEAALKAYHEWDQGIRRIG